MLFKVSGISYFIVPYRLCLRRSGMAQNTLSCLCIRFVHPIHPLQTITISPLLGISQNEQDSWLQTARKRETPSRLGKGHPHCG